MIDRRTSTTFLDVVFLILSVMTAAIMILIPHINPVGENQKITMKNPGSIAVEMIWDQGDIDIDLWVKAPGDRPVGYSNLSGKVFNLLRDDLGDSSDITRLNYENAYTRGMPDGKYIINVHAYANRAKKWPVNVLIRVWEINGNRSNTAFVRRTKLLFLGQEITVLGFRVVNGRIDRGSEDDTQVYLRSYTP